jgi:hypothetical protein
MGWLGNLVTGLGWLGDKAAHSQAPNLILKPCAVKGEAASRQLIIDKDYVQVRLRRIRIVYDRKGTKRYYGCVHSHASLLHARGGNAVFQMVTTPNELKNLDSGSVSRVIISDIPLLKAVPYRGDFLLELGLLSLESEGVDLVAPYLDLLGDMAETAGVGLVHQALSFAQPIQTGFNLLTGAGKKVELEVGIKSGIDRTGTWLLMRGPEELKSRLTLNAELQPVDDKGKPVEGYPYLVFSVEASDSRPDFLDIPEIRAAHTALMNSIMANDLNRAEKEDMPYFRRSCLVSPDLLLDHARALVKNQEDRMKLALGTRQVSAAEIKTWSLQDISPFSPTH